MSIVKEFKDFAVKGNVVDMAVGLIIGAEFGKIVNSLVADVIMPPIGLLVGGVDFKNLFIVLKESATQAAPYASLAEAQKAGAVTMNIGLFITTVITFTIVAFAVFMLVRAMNKLRPAAPKAALLLVSLLAFANSDVAMAQDASSVWKNESQAAVVVTDGNSETESYSLKQESALAKEKDTYKAKASYLKTSSESKTTGKNEETARKWDAGVRYERSLSEKWSAFVGHLVESDKYAGYIQRYNTDLGGKYIVAKEEKYDVISEAGYRYVHQNNYGVADENTHYNSARLYLEGNYKFNETNSGKLWAEYLPNFDDSDDYQTNWEASVSSALSSIFSLKVAYLSKTDHKVANSSIEKTDTTLTTALVAKF